MTLLIFARGQDGFVIVSDRKESEQIGLGNEVPKYCLPENEEFFLALAGDGTRSKSLFAHLRKLDVNSADIIAIIQNFIQSTYAESERLLNIDGFLVIKNEDRFEFYTASISRDRFVPSKSNARFFIIGDIYAKLILEHLVRNINFSNLPCEVVAKHLLAALDDVAETVHSVGDRTRFGFDVTAFLNSGQIMHRRRFADPEERLRIFFQLSNKEIFLHFKNNGDNNNE